MEYMWYMETADELYHHGIKGQKWGVRRFQNRDGSLTSSGRRRRGDESSGRRGKHSDESSGRRRLTTKQKVGIGIGIGAAAAGVGLMAYGNHRFNMQMRAEEARLDSIIQQGRVLDLMRTSRMVQTGSMPVSELANSANLARSAGVPENQILRSLSDIDDFFRN